MTIACTDLGIKLEMEKGRNEVILIENAWGAKFIVSNLYAQLRGDNGAVALYENEKEMRFDKCGELIINPFALDFNNRRIQTKLIAEAKILTEEYGRGYFEQIRRDAIEYMDKLSEHMPYHVLFNDEFEIQSLVKLLEVQLNYQDESFEEQLTSYVKIMNQLCGINLFVFVNLSQYIQESDYTELRKNMDYMDCYILLIETAVQHNCRKSLIIDKDLCMIE